MKRCINCNIEIADENNFCQNCGAEQIIRVNNQGRSGTAYFLVSLCILTIIGSLFGIARGWLYEMVSTMDTSDNYFRGWIYILTNIGTLTAAIIMLNRKMIGLYIYTVSQIIPSSADERRS